MDCELHYLRLRADFHRAMASRAACTEAKCAHDAFVEAYEARFREREGDLRRSKPVRHSATRSAPAGAALRRISVPCDGFGGPDPVCKAFVEPFPCSDAPGWTLGVKDRVKAPLRMERDPT